MSDRFERYVALALHPDNGDMSMAYVVDGLWNANLRENLLGMKVKPVSSSHHIFSEAKGMARAFAEDIIDTLHMDQRIFAACLFQEMGDILARHYHTAIRPPVPDKPGRAVDLSEPEPIRNPDE